ncbi:MAG: hypothetical protein KAW41_05460 [Candidatus Diapherotrites archaeon]|nr:hypothetical protein [Candidatus Diapherotrites archaeon]
MIKYHGKWLVIKRHPANEMNKLGLDPEDIVKFLEKGRQFEHREKGKVEKWCPRGDKIYNVVIAEYQDTLVLIHVGRFKKTKKHMARLR